MIHEPCNPEQLQLPLARDEYDARIEREVRTLNLPDFLVEEFKRALREVSVPTRSSPGWRLSSRLLADGRTRWVCSRDVQAIIQFFFDAYRLSSGTAVISVGYGSPRVDHAGEGEVRVMSGDGQFWVDLNEAGNCVGGDRESDYEPSMVDEARVAAELLQAYYADK